MWPIMDEHKLVRRIPITNGTHPPRATKRQLKRTTYRLEGNIPIPPVTRPAEYRERTPNTWGVLGAIRRMQVDQSFMVRCSEKERQKTRSAITSAVWTHNRRYSTSVKLVTRQVDGGIRVWRIA